MVTRLCLLHRVAAVAKIQFSARGFRPNVTKIAEEPDHMTSLRKHVNIFVVMLPSECLSVTFTTPDFALADDKGPAASEGKHFGG